ncbi:MAG: Aspartate/methionine/tyrosine aminotransferase [Candidatus Alkanophagales archaeon MCA70_species_1]|nr:Aspartate/methionine/tyrosine aminotransferase [Candidatus Alkanophaga volatiphilum]
MYASRLRSLPPYLFAEIDEKKARKKKEGADIIDLSVGDPDLPTPPHVVEALYEAAKDPQNHRYPTYEGLLAFREAVADWYKRRKGVTLDPETEVLTLIGSKEGIAHAAFAFLDAGDVALVPDPAYPVYKNATVLAGAVPHELPLTEENEFKPSLSEIDSEVAKKAKLLFLNYPNNPTAAVASKEFFKEVVDFAKDHDVVVMHDNPYSEITFDGYKAMSFLAADGAFEVGVEFNTLSKTYNMTGWRIGYVVGNADILKGIREIKTNVDSGVFQAVQLAAVAALKGPQDVIERNVRTYKERRDALIKGLKDAGIKAKTPKATFYVWARVPEGYTSLEFAALLLERAGVVVTPGIGFGTHGDGYVRFALTTSVERIKEACERIKMALGV